MFTLSISEEVTIMASGADGALERAVIAAIERLTGWADLSAESPLSWVLPTSGMRIAVLRELERKGIAVPFLDQDLTGWLARSHTWQKVGDLAEVVRAHQPEQG